MTLTKTVLEEGKSDSNLQKVMEERKLGGKLFIAEESLNPLKKKSA